MPQTRTCLAVATNNAPRSTIAPERRATASRPPLPPRRTHTLVLVVAILLPLALFAFNARSSWLDAVQAAEAEMGHISDAVAEYAQRVLDAHAVSVERINDLLHGLSDSEIKAREAELHHALARLLADGPLVQTGYVADRDGNLLLSASVFPLPPGPSFADREWHVALAGANPPPVFISRIHIGRIERNVFFVIARRRVGTGNGLPPGAWDGQVNVSIDPNNLSAALQRLTGDNDAAVALVRADGATLARTTPIDEARLPPIVPGSRFHGFVAAGLERASLSGVSVMDGIDRIGAFRKVDGYPVYAIAAAPRDNVAKRWRHDIAPQAALAVAATGALLGLGVLVQRGQEALARANRELERRVAERTSELADSEARLLLAQEAAGVGTFEWDMKSGLSRWSASEYAMFGMSPDRERTITDQRFLQTVHPDDRATVIAAMERAMHEGQLDVEFRIRRPRAGEGTEEEIRWLIGRGRVEPRPEDGRLSRVLGVNVDITERKMAEERQTLLAREVDHRAKNLLAVVQAALRLTRAATPAEFVQVLSGRIDALARAHSLLAQEQWAGAGLRDLLQGELAAFRSDSAVEGNDRVVLKGPKVTLAAGAAQSLSMVLHELATNAAKHGALAQPDGRLAVCWRIDRNADSLVLSWHETAGTRIGGVPKRSGFGMRVIKTSIEQQLGGTCEQHWKPEGLHCRIMIPLARTVTAGPQKEQWQA